MTKHIRIKDEVQNNQKNKTIKKTSSHIKEHSLIKKIADRHYCSLKFTLIQKGSSTLK